MTPQPSLDPRRAGDFARELLARARTWLPHWKLAPGTQDPGRALLEVAARLSAEVAERLDQVAEKNRRNLVRWLGIRGAAARGARVPVAFRLTDRAQRSVLARAPVQMQADAGGTTLVFESEADVLLVPARVAQVVAVDPARDAYYLPPPGLTSLDALPPVPTQWRVRSFAAAGSERLQLEPALGLAAGMILAIDGRQYRVTKLDDDIVTVDPAVDAPDGIAQDAIASKVAAFDPFDGAARNRQNHALYLGHTDLLNLEAAATIDVVNGDALGGFRWEYWGKLGESDAAWIELKVPPGQSQRNTLVVEKTQAGAIEPHEVNGVKSRWIRAVVPSLEGSRSPLPLADLKLRIGSSDAAGNPPCEGLTNTTPLVLDDTFQPLGREPRQFDAFYLGCDEVFSKKRAQVTLDFRLADTTFRSLAKFGPARGADAMLAGVASDRSLHLIAYSALAGTLVPPLERASLQPADPADPNRRVPLDAELPWRLPVWSGAGYVALAAAAGATVWMYYEWTTSPFFGQWLPLGAVVTNPVAGISLAGLVCVGSGGSEQLFALYDGQLVQRSVAGPAGWQAVQTAEAGAAVRLASIARIDAAPGITVAAGASRLVGISDAGTLYDVAADGSCTALPTATVLAVDVQPVAVWRTAADLLVFASAANKERIVAFDTSLGDDDIGLAAREKILGLTMDQDPTTQTVVASVQSEGDSRLVWWMPFAGMNSDELLDAPLEPATGQLGGAPTRLAGHVVVPGARSDVCVLPIDPGGLVDGAAPLEHWLVQPTAIAPLAVGDRVNSRDGLGGLARVAGAPTVVDGDRYTPLVAETIDPSYPADLLAFRTSAAGLATVFDSATASDCDLLLTVADALDGVDVVAITEGGVVRLFLVDTLTPGAGPSGETVATVRPALTGYLQADPVTVWPAVELEGEILPVLRLDRASTAVNIRDTTVEAASIVFPGATPARRRGTVVTRGLGSTAAAVALDGLFTGGPPTVAGEVRFTINGAPGAWQTQLGDASSNPELSWEYSDGKSWRLLPGLLDRTRHLKTSDTVTFEVPDDLVSSDWAGRTNHWIRARLVGGDYGREIFTVNSTTSGTTTTQSVERSSKGIKAPAVVALGIRYRLETAVHPEQVLAEDAGGFRDQSDANRTAGAQVEAFVPLAVTIGRLDGRSDESEASDGSNGAGPCDCNDRCGGGSPAPGGSADAAAAAPGRSLLVGIAGTAQGEPVNLLFAVAAERAHDAAAPLRVEALVAGRFEPLVAVDGTRALGESGLVTMTLPTAPTTTALFGQPLAWLRLTPSRESGWQPSIATAVLNAAWASAAETQTFEVLGSSGGEPDLTLTIARPPLLRDSLELRIREALTDEEVGNLKSGDAMRVRSDVPGLPGHWVRWEPVVDPADSAAGERVYALDEATGTVRFGDGRHGMIPPIGRDHIVAFRYRRVEPLADAAGAAAAITARAALGLVTPLEGVEAVVAAADAGRGAPPDDVERVLRFAPAQLRHRERALSARDVEDIVLQAQPAVAQARCLTQSRPVRLIVALRGPNPVPSRAMVRELAEVLARVLPPTLTGAMAPKLEGPTLREFRIRATLRVPALDTAGRVAQRAHDALAAYFDPAHGGDDGHGWPLGRAPAVDDVAARLIDLEGLEGIDDLALFERSSRGDEPLTGPLGPDELARLAHDGIAFRYALVGVTP